MSDTAFRFQVQGGRWVEIAASGGLLARGDIPIIKQYLAVLEGAFASIDEASRIDAVGAGAARPHDVVDIQMSESPSA